MESPVVFLLTLATITFAPDHVCSQTIYPSQNPIPVGSNVTLYSQSTVTQGAWIFNNDIVVMIFSGAFIIDHTWRDRVSFNLNTSSLTIMSLQLGDSGIYTLQGLNAFRAKLTLSVQVPVSNVTLKANATNLVEFNDTAVFMCSVSNGSSLSYAWLKGHSELTAGGKVLLSNGNATLTIVSVTRYDSGPFRCNVSNGVSHEISPPVYLNISYGPSNGTMMISPMVPKKIYRTGSNITLSCSAESSPAATIKWMFNGVYLNKIGSEIQLDNVTESDSGTYKCVFHNMVTSRFSSTSIMLWVLDPLEVVVVNHTGGPAILDETFTLQCEVIGSADRIQWWRNWQLLSPNDNDTMVFDDNNRTLILNPVQRSDNGDYKCQAFNHVSNMTSSPYKVEVNYGPEMPTIMGPAVAKTGDNVKFSCYASSNPPSLYRWYLHDDLVANTYVYVTPPLTKNMSGIYTCKAYNNVTGQNKTAYKMLTVMDPLEDVRIEAPMDPPKDGYPYTLTCNATGPVEHVYWMKDGMELHEDNRTSLNMENQTVTFDPLKRNDTGYYQCTAMNAVSNMTSPSYKLLVNYGPDTPVINGPMFAETGKIVTFHCSAMSVPPSQFSWWFNGTEVANTSVFTTGPLSLNMSGEYTCMAHNYVMGMKSNTSKLLTVIEAIESVMIINNTVPVNDKNFTLTCEVTGPYDMIYWMKNNMTISLNHKDYHTEKNMLHFTPLAIYNDGTYQCVATNRAGKHESPPYMLLVNYGPLSVNITGPSSENLGLSVSLRCSADSRPDCDFYWFLNTTSSAVLHTGSVITFSATKESEGKYICKARNPVTSITMEQTKAFTVSGHASAIHFPTRGGLMLIGVFALFAPVLSY